MTTKCHLSRFYENLLIGGWSSEIYLRKFNLYKRHCESIDYSDARIIIKSSDSWKYSIKKLDFEKKTTFCYHPIIENKNLLQWQSTNHLMLMPLLHCTYCYRRRFRNPSENLLQVLPSPCFSWIFQCQCGIWWTWLKGWITLIRRLSLSTYLYVLW